MNEPKDLFGVEDEPEVEEEEPEGLSVEGDEDDDDDNELSRKERRARRGRIHEALQEERSGHQKTREELAELKGRFSSLEQRLQSPPQPPPEDSIKKGIEQTYTEEDELRQEAEAVMRANNGEISAEQRKRFDQKHREILSRRNRLDTLAVMREAGIRPVDPSEGIQAQLRMKYSDVFANQRAEAWAKARWAQYRAQGYDESEELVDTVMRETRSAFKLGGKPQRVVSEAQRQKYVGVAGGGPGPRSGQRVVRMDADLKAIAEAKYPGLSPTAAHKKWAKEIGPGYLEDMEKA